MVTFWGKGSKLAKTMTMKRTSFCAEKIEFMMGM